MSAIDSAVSVRIVGLALRHLDGDRPDDVRHLALQVTDAGLARVLLDDRRERLVVDSLICCVVEAVLGDLLGHQVALGDLQLLLAGVAGDLEHLHAVEQRRAGSVSSMFAVAMKMTFERSKVTSR